MAGVARHMAYAPDVKDWAPRPVFHQSWKVIDHTGKDTGLLFSNAPCAAETAIRLGGTIEHWAYGRISTGELYLVSGMLAHERRYAEWLEGRKRGR